jgi:CheY-like chemotaxis protein
MVSLQDRRIFIIDDNPVNVTAAKMLLERHYATVGFDRWGTNVPSKLAQFAPVDLILLDLALAHDTSGYDVFDQIRAMPGFETVPIVAYSAGNATEAIPLTQAKGFSGYIAKPLDFDAFPDQIEQILSGMEIWLAR